MSLVPQELSRTVHLTHEKRHREKTTFCDSVTGLLHDTVINFWNITSAAVSEELAW